MKSSLLLRMCLWTALLLFPVSTFAKFPPEKLTNLKVLPEDTTIPELITTMKGFTQALGVRCQHCHVGEDGMPLSQFDFPSDEKETKQTARVMLRMLENINQQQLAKVPEGMRTGLKVTCATCHRGQERPLLIPDALTRKLEEDGIEAMLAHYDGLREQYYGSHTYDFTEWTLSFFAEDLVAAGRLDAAYALQEKNAHYYPESSYVQMMLGYMALQQGRQDQARVHANRALELDENNRGASSLLQKLDAPPADTSQSN